MTIPFAYPLEPIKVTADTPMLPHDLGKLFEDRPSTFTAVGALPAGLELTSEGFLRGIPSSVLLTGSPHKIKILASENRGDNVEFTVELYVFPPLTPDDIRNRQTKIWDDLSKFGEIQQLLPELLSRPVSKEEIAYLLQRFAYFIVWNADDLRLADNGQAVEIEGLNEHYLAYNFDVCLLVTPKSLYDGNRVILHGDEAARSLIQEAHRRKWQVEFGGHPRMARIAWFEAQRLNEGSEFQMQVKNYTPHELRKEAPQATPGG